MKTTAEFLGELKENEELAKELLCYLADAGCDDKDAAIEATRSFAMEKGYEFNEQEITPAEAENAACELGDEELDDVNGGGFIQRFTTGMRQFLLDYLGFQRIKI